MNELKKKLQRIDTIGQELKKDHPGDNRPKIKIVKSDIQFEKGFAETLSKQKRTAEAAVLLFKTGVWLDKKKPVGDRMATVKATNNKLKPYFRVDKKGNIYFLPIVSGIPYHFPSFAMAPNQAIALIDDLEAQNDVQLAKRKSQLSLLEQEQRLQDELSSLERKAKTVADLWIYDPHLEDTGRKNTYKAAVGTTLRFKILVRYNDDTDETLTHDPANGIYLSPSTLKVDSAKKYMVCAYFSIDNIHTFTVEGYYRQDLISFAKKAYRAREGRDEIITIELQREGTGKGSVTARFREILGKGTSAGDYAVIDPFPTWEAGKVGKKSIRVKIYDNKDSSYNKVIKLQLESTSGVDLKYPKSTQITIEDDDMGGRLRFMAPRYNVEETEKRVRIGIERVGEGALNRVTVRIQTLNGSAKDGEDYKAFSDTLTWGPTDKDIKHVEIPIIEDKVKQGAETFQVILSDPTGGAVLGTPNTTEITIRDVKDRQDGIQKARFSRSEYRAGEGGAGIRITVHREGGGQGEFKVDYLTQDAYAQAGEDYETSHGTLTWKDGDDLPQDFMVKIIDDQEPEPRPETIHLQLENPRNPEVSVGFDATGTEAVIYIEDNDSETEEKPPETDTPTTSSTGLSAALDCGDSFELAPGDFAGRGRGIVVRGWRRNTKDRVEVVVDYDTRSGIEVFPGNTSAPPSLMYTAGVVLATHDRDRYVFSQSFRARSDAPPGTTPITITVRQEGAGSATLSLNVAVLRKGQLPSTGPGIRPPATVTQGSGGEYCVWRFKMYGDPPPCFHFVAAKCDTPRYSQPSYELVGQGMRWGEADAQVSELSRYYQDAYGCLPGPKQKKVVSIVVIPSGRKVRVFETVTFTAMAIFDDGSQENITARATWPSGKSYTPSQSGPFTMNASYMGKTGFASVSVLPPKVLFITVYPGNITILIGETVTFSAQATFENHTVKDVTGKVVWTLGSHVFVGQEERTYNMQAKYRGASDYSTITVVECILEADCPDGYVCSNNRCVSPMDSSYGTFGDIRASADADRSMSLAMPPAGVGRPGFTGNGLGQDLDKMQEDLRFQCSDKRPCPTGYECVDGKCVKKHDGESVKDKPECTGDAQCENLYGNGYKCDKKTGKCVKKSEAKPINLVVSPANKVVTINQPVTLKAILKREDGSTKDVDVTQEATWVPRNPFSEGNIGLYPVKATYKNLSGTAMITVVKEKGMQDITVNSRTINVTVWDSGLYEDGDKIAILVNGRVVHPEILLTFQHQSIPITIDGDVIVFGFRALNEGTKKPNTATVIFTNVTKGKSKQKYVLKKNQKTNMNITYSP